MENNWEDYINYIFDGEAVLFLGAGFSCNNLNINGKKLPLTTELSKLMQLESGIPSSEVDDTLNVQMTSEYLIDEKGETKVVNLLKETFTVANALEWQTNLAKYNWKRVYTSNYDNVFEVASSLANKHRVPINIARLAMSKGKKSEEEVIHLNGYIDDITEENLYNSTKLTSESYTDTYFLDSPWRNEFDIDLEHSKAIFFIGFSLNYDLDLKRLIAANKAYKDKIFFINGTELTNISITSLSKFGRVIPMGGEEFSNILLDKYSEYIPSADTKLRTLSFSKSNFKIVKDKVMDKEVIDLLSLGSVNENKIYSLPNSSSYIIQRTCLKTAHEILNKNKVLMVHGKLGNGKSIFLKNLECDLTRKGKSVYVYNGNPNDILNDVEKLKVLDEQIVLIIDDYYAIKSQFKFLSRLKSPNFKFIISGRTFINDNIYSDFVSKTGFNEKEVISLNIDAITNQEVSDTIELLSEHNLWGKKSSYNSQKKKNYLRNISRQGFKNIALEVVKSNNIVSKINSTYIDLPKDTKNIIILLLINNLIKSNLRVNQLQTLTNNMFFSKKIIDDPNFKEFLDIENNKIIMSSGIASVELLKLEKDKRKIIRVMKDTLKKADKIDSKKTYDYLKRSLVSFSNFRLIMGRISDIDLNNLAVEYYEEIKNTNFAKDNPFFWLQFGIQKLDEKEYQLANIYFDNALSFADKKGYSDFYQINAQKARGIIEEIVGKTVSSDESYSYFEKAHKLLISDLNRATNKKSYQLSQGHLYEQYYQKYYKHLSNPQKMDFMAKVKVYKDYLEQYIRTQVAGNIKQDYKIQRSLKAFQNIKINK